MIINFRNWNHNKNNMLTSSNGNQILFKFSSIKLNLKLKFECKVRLVIELGPQSHKHFQEPSLINDQAEFGNNVELITHDILHQKVIGLNIYVISARNKYKAGVCKLEVNDLTMHNQSDGQIRIQKKLQQCPDKQAYLSMIVCYQLLQGDSLPYQNKYRRMNSIQQDRCTSIISINDIGKFADLQDDSRNSFGSQSLKNWQVADRNKSWQKPDFKRHLQKRQSIDIKTQKQIKKTKDLTSIPFIKMSSRDNDFDFVPKKIDKRGSVTPKTQGMKQRQQLKRTDLRRTKNNILGIDTSRQAQHHLQRENKFLKLQIRQLQQQIKQLRIKTQLHKTQVIDQQNIVNTLKQTIQTQNKKIFDLEIQISKITHRFQLSKSEIQQIQSSLQVAEKRCDTKVSQYKGDVQKLLDKMILIEQQNRRLLFESNKLKDDLIDKDITFQNMNMNIQTQTIKFTRVNSNLTSKIQQLETQLQLLSFNFQVEKTKRQQISNELLMKQKILQSKNKQLELSRQNSMLLETKIVSLEKLISQKQNFIENVIKKLKQLTLTNDQIKVQYNEITENQIIPLIQTISKSIKSDAFKMQEILNHLDIKKHSVQRLENDIKETQIIMKKMEQDVVCLNNLYEETKFRLQVQLTTVEVLQQDLFDTKTQLEYQQDKLKENILLQQKYIQLQAQNSQLMAHIDQIQKQKQKAQYFQTTQHPFSLIKKKLSLKHKHRISGVSNFSQQQDIKIFINQLQSRVTQFWEGDQIIESPIRPKKDISIISEQMREFANETPF